MLFTRLAHYLKNLLLYAVTQRQPSQSLLYWNSVNSHTSNEWIFNNMHLGTVKVLTSKPYIDRIPQGPQHSFGQVEIEMI